MDDNFKNKLELYLNVILKNYLGYPDKYKINLISDKIILAISEDYSMLSVKLRKNSELFQQFKDVLSAVLGTSIHIGFIDDYTIRIAI